MPQKIIEREIPGIDEQGIRDRLKDPQRVARAMNWISNLDGNRLQIAVSSAKRFGTEEDIISFVDAHNSEDPRGFACWILDHHATIENHQRKTNEEFMDNARQLALSTNHERAGVVARWFLDRLRQGLIDTDSKSFTSVNTSILNEITRTDEEGEWPAIDPEKLVIGKASYEMIQVDRESMLAAARTVHQHYGLGPVSSELLGETVIQIDDETFISQAAPSTIKAHAEEKMASFVVGVPDIQGTSCLITLWIEDGEWKVANASPGLRWPENIDVTSASVLEYLRENVDT